MKIVFLGDIVSKPGREALKTHLPKVRSIFKPDLIIANGENAAHCVGISPKIADEIFALGVDGITGGDHSLDRSEIIPYMAETPHIIRPLNWPKGNPGRGVMTLKTAHGFVLVVNLLGRVFMNPVDDPFAAIENVLENHKLGRDVAAILVDFHAEATSEMMAMGHVLNGRVSAVLGTHTHVPTADAHILSGGTALQCDVGMCGDYNSIIGVQPEEPIHRFTKARSSGRFEPTTGKGTICGCCVTIDPKSGKATDIQPFKYGPVIGQPS